METGTCCWPALLHICNYNAPGSHNRPWETESFDLQILRGALHAEPKIKYWFTGFGSKGGEGRRWWWWWWWWWWWGSLVSLFRQGFFSFPSVELSEWDESSDDEVMTNTEPFCHQEHTHILHTHTRYG